MVAAEKSLYSRDQCSVTVGNQHPTQTLADLQTIRSLHGDLKNFTIGRAATLNLAVPVHSLGPMHWCATKASNSSSSPPKSPRSPAMSLDMLREKGIPFQEVIRLEDVMPKPRSLYMTRVQKERFFLFNEEGLRPPERFLACTPTPEKMELAKPEDAGAVSPSHNQ